MKKALPLILLVGLLVLFRLAAAQWSGALPGFEPLSAVFFCTAACVGWRWLWIPLVAWLLSYPLTNEILGYLWDWQAVLALAGFGLVVALGGALRGSGRTLPLLAGSAGAAVLFYVVTNAGSWMLLPDYPKTWTGFVQAQWTGAPHHALPTWVFLKNSILANVLFTALFLLGQRQWLPEVAGKPAPVRARGPEARDS